MLDMYNNRLNIGMGLMIMEYRFPVTIFLIPVSLLYLEQRNTTQYKVQGLLWIY